MTREPYHFPIPDDADHGQCQSCEAPIRWVKTKAGKNLPVNPDGIAHFATCPEADKHRKPRGNQKKEGKLEPLAEGEHSPDWRAGFEAGYRRALTCFSWRDKEGTIKVGASGQLLSEAQQQAPEALAEYLRGARS